MKHWNAILERIVNCGLQVTPPVRQTQLNHQSTRQATVVRY